MKGGNDSRAQDGTKSRLEHSEFWFLYIFLSARARMHVYVYKCYISERVCRDKRPKLVSFPCPPCLCVQYRVSQSSRCHQGGWPGCLESRREPSVCLQAYATTTDFFYIGSEADLGLHACTSNLLTEESPSPAYLFITRMFCCQEPHYHKHKVWTVVSASCPFCGRGEPI